MTHTVVTNSPKQTEAIASAIGSKLLGGEIIELLTDVGGGKTTFVRGLAKGAGSTDHVSSPTFKISNIYKVSAKKPNHTHRPGKVGDSATKLDGAVRDIWHFDFYRLPEAGLIEHELAEVLGDPKAAIVIEWSNVIKHVLPEERLKVRINVVNENSRQLVFEYPSSLSYLFEK